VNFATDHFDHIDKVERSVDALENNHTMRIDELVSNHSGRINELEANHSGRIKALKEDNSRSIQEFIKRVDELENTVNTTKTANFSPQGMKVEV
jgi:hypothetical protein